MMDNMNVEAIYNLLVNIKCTDVRKLKPVLNVQYHSSHSTSKIYCHKNSKFFTEYRGIRLNVEHHVSCCP